MEQHFSINEIVNDTPIFHWDFEPLCCDDQKESARWIWLHIKDLARKYCINYCCNSGCSEMSFYADHADQKEWLLAQYKLHEAFRYFRLQDSNDCPACLITKAFAIFPSLKEDLFMPVSQISWPCCDNIEHGTLLREEALLKMDINRLPIKRPDIQVILKKTLGDGHRIIKYVYECQKLNTEDKSLIIENKEEQSTIKHSPNYRTVLCNGKEWKLTDKKAEVIKKLHEAHKKGVSKLSEAEIFADYDDSTPIPKVKNLFRPWIKWEELINKDGQGFFWLNIK